jgi:hypothetical protein
MISFLCPGFVDPAVPGRAAEPLLVLVFGGLRVVGTVVAGAAGRTAVTEGGALFATVRAACCLLVCPAAIGSPLS